MDDFAELADISGAVFDPQDVGVFGELTASSGFHIDPRKLGNIVEQDSYSRRFGDGNELVWRIWGFIDPLK